MTSKTTPHGFIGLVVAGLFLVAACGSTATTSDAVGREEQQPEDVAITAEADPEQLATPPATTTFDEPEPTPEPDPTAVPTPADEPTETEGSATSLELVSRLGSYEMTDADFGSSVTVTVDGAIRTIVSNALPDHATGDFPNSGNPNTISEQNLVREFTTKPLFTGDATGAREIGIAVNGVKFEPGTAETVTCASGEVYRIEAIQDLYNLGLDFNNAHVQPTGEYHYHGVSELLVAMYGDQAADDTDLVHVGFAADGFLIYYSKSNAYPSSFRPSAELRVGADCVASGPAGGTSIEIQDSTPDGTYTSDWVFDEDAGVLDNCNGTIVDDSYVYFVTDAYPYISRCLNGEVAAGQGGPAQGQTAPGTAPAGAAPARPDFTDAASALGISVEELQSALGGPPPDFDAAAAKLGVTVDELRSIMPAPPG